MRPTAMACLWRPPSKRPHTCPTSHETFVATLALIGLVILVSSLLSGAVERSGLPQVAIFLLLGALLAAAGCARRESCA